MSLLGSSLVQYAISWYITLETKSGVFMMLSILCTALPQLFMSPFAGVWADRFDRKKLIVLADGGIALVTLLLALAFGAGYRAFWLLFAALAVRSLGSAVQTPAVSAFLPQLVPQEHLMKVNGVNSTIQSIVFIASPMLGAGLYAALPMEYIFAVDVVTAAIAIFIMLAFIKVPPHKKALEKQEISYFHDLKEGLSYVRRRPYLVHFFVVEALFLLLAGPSSMLTPIQVALTFGDNEMNLALIELLFSVGMLAGGVVVSAWGGFKNRVYTMALATFLFAVGTFALGVAPWFWLYLAVMGFLGMSMPCFNVPAAVLLQETVDGDFMGRVFSVMTMVSGVCMPLGMVLWGPLADAVPISLLLIVTGILLVPVALYTAMNPALVEAGKPKAKDAPETNDNH